MQAFPTIFLLGYMGSGKSYTGRRLAELLHVPFVDLDRRIEEREGRSISRIVAEAGLPYFRQREAECLRELPARNTVVACGGGTPIYHDNLAWMNQRGITFYLDTPVAILAERLTPEMAHRPLLQGLTAQDLPEFIKRHLSERLPAYLGAHLRYAQSTGDEPIAQDIRNYLLRITGH